MERELPVEFISGFQIGIGGLSFEDDDWTIREILDCLLENNVP